MSAAVETDAVALELAGGASAKVALFAGGTTGLVLLDSTGGWQAFWTPLAERAELEGLSALAFAAPVTGDPANAAVRAARALERLGVEQLVIAAAAADGAAALRAAAGGAFAAAVIVEPVLAESDVELLLEPVPMPKLVLIVGEHAQADAIRRHAIGPTVIRHLPASDRRHGQEPLAGEPAALAAEAILGFAIGVCGDGRHA